MKRKLKWLLAASILLALTGLITYRYSRGGNEEETGPQNIHILISLGGDSGHKVFYDSVINNYNNHHEDILLVPFYVQSDTHAMLKLIYSGEANQRYDIACLGAEQLYTLKGMALVTPLDGYILRDKGLSWLEAIKPVMIADTMDDGEIVSLPFIRNATVLYYNKENAAAFNEILSLEQLLKLADHEPVVLPVERILLEMLAYQPSYSIARPSLKRTAIHINSQESIDLISRYQQALDEKKIISYTENSSSGNDIFLEGGAGYFVGSTYYYGEIIKEAPFEVGCIPLMLDEETTFPLHGSNLYMTVQREIEYDIVWSVMQELLDYSYCEELLERMDHLMMTKEDDGGSSSSNSDALAAFAEICGYEYNSFSAMAVEQNAKIRLLLESGLSNILNRQADPQQLIPQLQKQIDDILKNEP